MAMPEMKEFSVEVEAETEPTQEIDSETKAKMLTDIVSDPTKALNTKISTAMAQKIDQRFLDENVQERLDTTSDRLIDKSLNTVENKVAAEQTRSEDEKNKAEFDKDKEVYQYFGIGHKLDNPKKKELIRKINDFWDYVWIIVASFTTVPLNKWLMRLKTTTTILAKTAWTTFPIILFIGVLFCIIGLPIMHVKGII